MRKKPESEKADKAYLTRMYCPALKSGLRTWQIPCCDEVHFYGNENGSAEAGEYRNGNIISIDGNAPDWIAGSISFLENESYE